MSLTGLKVPRKTFINDMISGLVMAAVTVPGALANGLLAGVNPVYGVYSVIAGTAVAALLAEKIRYAEIPRIIEESLAASPGGEISSLEEALTVDQLARKTAAGLIDRLDSGRP